MEVEDGVEDLVSCAGVEASLLPMITSRSVLCSSWHADMVVLANVRSMVEVIAARCDVDLAVSAILKSRILLDFSRIRCRKRARWFVEVRIKVQNLVHPRMFSNQKLNVYGCSPISGLLFPSLGSSSISPS